MMRFKQALSVLSAAALSLVILASCGKSDSSAGQEKKREFKDMTAQEYVSEMGIGENLGNTFESYFSEPKLKDSGSKKIGENKPLDYETCWGAVETTKEVIDGMKEAGFSTVRVPVYWGNMNGKLKSLFDRIVYVMMGESKFGIPLPLNKKKKAIIVTSCTTPFPFNYLCRQSTGATKALKEILKYSGFKIIRTKNLAGTKEKE